MRSRNSTIFLLWAVSRRLYWKFHRRPFPQTGLLPYLEGSPGHALNQGCKLTGLNTLKITFDMPHTLLMSVTPFTVIEIWSAWFAAVGYTPSRLMISLDLVPKFH